MDNCQLECIGQPTCEDTLVRENAEFLDLARTRAGLKSDYQLAKRLGITRQYVSKMRAGIVPIPEHVAEELGDLTGIDGGVIYAEMMAARAKRTDARTFWERIARSLAAALAVVFVGFFVSATDAPAAPRASAHDIHYAHWPRRAWRRLCAACTGLFEPARTVRWRAHRYLPG